MADVPPEKSLDDFFAKRDKKKKKEKGKGKESATGPTSAVIKKNKREREKSAKNENQDAHIEKVTLLCNFLVRGLLWYRRRVKFGFLCQSHRVTSLKCPLHRWKAVMFHLCVRENCLMSAKYILT